MQVTPNNTLVTIHLSDATLAITVNLETGQIEDREVLAHTDSLSMVVGATGEEIDLDTLDGQLALYVLEKSGSTGSRPDVATIEWS